MIDVDIQHLYPHMLVVVSAQALCNSITLEANTQIAMRVQISEFYSHDKFREIKCEDVATNKTETHTLKKECVNEPIPTCMCLYVCK